MKSFIKKPYDLILSISAGALLWFFAFSVDYGHFWIKIIFAALCLMVMSFVFGPRKKFPNFNLNAVIFGIISAAILYGIFFACYLVSDSLFPFVSRHISGIYDKILGPPMWILCLFLLFITGPAEELFWRGFIQDRLMTRLGNWQGLAITTCLYAAFHLVTGNIMLIAAAGVAGGFWGLMYMYNKKLAPVIISHSIWSVCAFALFPMQGIGA